ncbi:PREDICTED: 27 kDa hemolymph protein-like, partial [Nicrophorus vespilloides]|uniref:27 kDa hemolymph protein-like n=1 Tax=Nicrophorus vespilloides TaxID=110193 RepID=A0ABM1M419_NICVS
MKTYNAVVIAALFIGAVLCQLEDLDLDNVKNQIPGLENFNQSALPQKEEVEKALREKCKKNGDENSFDDIVNSKDAVQECVQKYVNQTVIMEELEVAKKDGSMDEVFGKYCKKRPEIMACVTDVLKKVEKCLEPEEKTSLKVLINVVDKVGNFSCFKDGDRLALFVAESGLECLEQSKDGIQFCANQTFQSRVPKDLSITNLPIFTIGEQECSDMEKFQVCAVKEFEKCESNTPANVIEALFKFIRRETPCKNFDSAKPAATRKFEADPNSSTICVASLLLVAMTSLLAKIIN